MGISILLDRKIAYGRPTDVISRFKGRMSDLDSA